MWRTGKCRNKIIELIIRDVNEFKVTQSLEP